jgi:hypothetical protein
LARPETFGLCLSKSEDAIMELLLDEPYGFLDNALGARKRFEEFERSHYKATLIMSSVSCGTRYACLSTDECLLPFERNFIDNLIKDYSNTFQRYQLIVQPGRKTA